MQKESGTELLDPEWSIEDEEKELKEQDTVEEIEDDAGGLSWVKPEQKPKGMNALAAAERELKEQREKKKNSKPDLESGSKGNE